MKKSRYPEFKKVDGKVVCRGCGGDVPKGRQTWCSKTCYDTHCPQRVIYFVKLRDKGICQLCKGDISATCAEYQKRLKLIVREVPVPYDAVENVRLYNKYLSAREALINSSPYPEYDHVIPFSKGGKTILENMRTLCSICHKKVTKEFAAERAREKRLAKQPELSERFNDCIKL